MSVHHKLNCFHGEKNLIEAILPSQAMDKAKTPEEKLDAAQTLYHLALEALAAYEGNRLIEFDCSAGDQACQIRALLFNLLKKEDLKDEISSLRRSCLEKIQLIAETRLKIKALNTESQTKIESLKTSLEPFRLKNKEIQARFEAERNKLDRKDPNYNKDFAEVRKKFQPEFDNVKREMKNTENAIQDIQQKCLKECHSVVSSPELDTKLSEKILFLVRAYIINKAKNTKQEQVNENGLIVAHDLIIVKQLKIKDVNFPHQIFQEAIQLNKIAIVKLSIKFVQEEAQNCKSDELNSMVLQPRDIKGKEHQELPFYYMTKIIFLNALYERIPIVLKIRNENVSPLEKDSFICKVLLKVNEATKSYFIAPLGEETTGIILEGRTAQKLSKDDKVNAKLIENILSEGQGILNLIDLNTAQHTQYSDQDMTKFTFDDIPGISEAQKKHLIEQRTLAEKKGFSYANGSQVAIEHVYPDLISSHFT